MPDLRRLLQAPGPDDEAPAWSADRSIWSLALANVFALVMAVWSGWNLRDLMLVYWGQSVVIGISYVFRLLALDRFSTKNFKINDRPVDPTPETKRQVAAFFALHYGGFHAAYFVFLVAEGGARAAHGLEALACVAAFAVNHLWSYRYNRDLDRQGTPNIGTMMFTPYARVVPMHLAIVFGAAVWPTAVGLLLFGGLKTVADVVMHVVEHAQLKRLREGSGD